MGVKETAHIIEDVIAPEDLKKIEAAYSRKARLNEVTSDDKFQYGMSLIRSIYEDDVNSGMQLMKELIDSGKYQTAERECLYFLAVGNFKLKQYTKADELVKVLMQKEPNNKQAKDLHDLIKQKQTRDGLIGAAVLGGAATMGLAGVIAAGAVMLMAKKK